MSANPNFYSFKPCLLPVEISDIDAFAGRHERYWSKIFALVITECPDASVARQPDFDAFRQSLKRGRRTGYEAIIETSKELPSYFAVWFFPRRLKNGRWIPLARPRQTCAP
jgi:hypothetical protein